MKGIKFFLIAFFVSLPFWSSINFFQDNLEQFFYAQISQPFQNISEIKIPPKPQKPTLDLEAKSAISVKVKKTGKEIIVFEKDSEKILPIASLTKLMTAVIILEDPISYDFSKIWTISKTAEAQDNVPNYGNLKAGESFKIENLFNLMLAYSSNDAAYALSEVIGTENFIEKMNLKAKELGMNNTHFINPTGLDPEDENLHYNLDNQDFFNYSTVQDLLKLVQYILKEQPLIFEISSRGEPYAIENGISDLKFSENQKILGGKTGYTDEAGGCLIFLFQNEKGDTSINIILGTPSMKDRPQAMKKRIEEAQKLIDWLSL